MGIIMKFLLIAAALGIKLQHTPRENWDLREEGDMKDDVVDYNGGTNRGYAGKEPYNFAFFRDNHINHAVGEGHFGTIPREEVDNSAGYTPYTNEDNHVAAFDTLEPDSDATESPYKRYCKMYA